MSANTLDLEKKWEVWCQYLEEQKELDTMTAAARERLLNLLCRRETGHRLTKKTILKELEVFWKMYSCQSVQCADKADLFILRS